MKHHRDYNNDWLLDLVLFPKNSDLLAPNQNSTTLSNAHFPVFTLLLFMPFISFDGANDYILQKMIFFQDMLNLSCPSFNTSGRAQIRQSLFNKQKE